MLRSLIRQLRGEPDTTPERCPVCSGHLSPTLICRACGHDANWDAWSRYLKALSYMPIEEQIKALRYLKPEERAHVDALLREQYLESLKKVEAPPELPVESEVETAEDTPDAGDTEASDSETPPGASPELEEEASAYRRFTFGGDASEASGIFSEPEEKEPLGPEERELSMWPQMPWESEGHGAETDNQPEGDFGSFWPVDQPDEPSLDSILSDFDTPKEAPQEQPEEDAKPEQDSEINWSLLSDHQAPPPEEEGEDEEESKKPDKDIDKKEKSP